MGSAFGHVSVRGQHQGDGGRARSGERRKERGGGRRDRDAVVGDGIDLHHKTLAAATLSGVALWGGVTPGDFSREATFVIILCQ